MVSGKLVPKVSGKIRESSPAITEEAPNTTNGRACPKWPPTKVLYKVTKKKKIFLKIKSVNTKLVHVYKCVLMVPIKKLLGCEYINSKDCS